MTQLTKYVYLFAAAVLYSAILVGVVYVWRGIEKDDEWRDRIRNAPPTIKSTRDTVYVDRKPERGTVVPRKLPQVDPEQDLQAVNDLLRMDRDSLRSVLLQLMATRKIPIRTRAIGELIVTLRPRIDRPDSCSWIHTPPPQMVLVDTTWVERLILTDDDPWWETPAIVAGSVAVGYSLAVLTRRDR